MIVTSKEQIEMPFYVVTMSHPDGPEWNEHVKAHVDYLESLIDEVRDPGSCSAAAS
jgi:hypothetical protein